MTTVAPTNPNPTFASTLSKGPVAPFPRNRKARLATAVMLAAGLVLSSVARQYAMGLQAAAHDAGPYANTAGTGGDATAGSAVSSSIGSLDSYFLVLMLGGLRGPLVMYLWSSSESQKNERDLEDFNTKVNLIRLLQPEFDSVHIFQSWNKAYNVSVQIASLPDRYATILDAGDYVRQVDRSRPNNVNILLQLNQVYGQKLGQTAQDNVYYRRQVRLDSKWRPAEAVQTYGSLTQRMAPLLDEKDRLLPSQLGYVDSARERRRPNIAERPADLRTTVHVPASRVDDLRKAAAAAGVSLDGIKLTPAAGAADVIFTLVEGEARKLQAAFSPVDAAYVYADWNDGSELQYLKDYEPFSYGVSPLALGFDYGKRAQVLINRTKQRPAQYSPSVVDSRPGLELRDWAKEERERAQAAELRWAGKAGEPAQFGKWMSAAPTNAPQPTGVPLAALVAKFLADPSSPAAPARAPGERFDEQVAERFVTAMVAVAAPTKPASGADVDEALFSYRQSAHILRDARGEFVRHLSNPEIGIRRLQDFTSQMDELIIDQLMVEGDHDFLLAFTPGEGNDRDPLYGQPKLVGRKPLLERAAARYREALTWARYINMRYYMPAEVTQLTLPPAASANFYAYLVSLATEPYYAAFANAQLAAIPEIDASGRPYRFVLPPGTARERLEQLRSDPAKLDALYDRTLAAVKAASRLDQNASNREESEPNEMRAVRRMEEIAKLLK